MSESLSFKRSYVISNEWCNGRNQVAEIEISWNIRIYKIRLKGGRICCSWCPWKWEGKDVSYGSYSFPSRYRVLSIRMVPSMLSNIVPGKIRPNPGLKDLPVNPFFIRFIENSWAWFSAISKLKAGQGITQIHHSVNIEAEILILHPHPAIEFLIRQASI